MSADLEARLQIAEGHIRQMQQKQAQMDTILAEMTKAFHKMDVADARREAIAEQQERRFSELEKDLEGLVSLPARFSQLEEGLKSIHGLGKWMLATVGSVVLVALVGFILQGGLNGIGT